MSKYFLSCLNLSYALRRTIFIFLLTNKFQYKNKIVLSLLSDRKYLFDHISNDNGSFPLNVDVFFPL